MAKRNVDPEFPCSLVVRTPFPTHRLASSALKALQVDAELSPMVRRSFTLVSPLSSSSIASSKASTNGTPSLNGVNGTSTTTDSKEPRSNGDKTILVTEYKAKTNRMLRVAVNGFMESLGVVLGVMERLDVDVLPSASGPGATSAASAAMTATVGAAKN